MASEAVYLTGVVKWVKAIKPNKWGDWSLDFYPTTPDSINKMMELKKAPAVKNLLRQDDDGKYMTFKRPTSKEIRGKVQGFQPPLLLDGNKKMEDGSFAPLVDTNIGNGSSGVLKLEVYGGTKKMGPDEAKWRAARWDSLRIDNLIPYKSADFSEEDLKLAEGMKDQPAEALF